MTTDGDWKPKELGPIVWVTVPSGRRSKIFHQPARDSTLCGLWYGTYSDTDNRPLTGSFVNVDAATTKGFRPCSKCDGTEIAKRWAKRLEAAA